MSRTRLITIGAAAAALSALCVVAAGSLPTGRLALYFASSLFVYALAAEDAYLHAALSFLTAGLVAFLLLGNKPAVLPFAFLLGHFGIVKRLLDRFIPRRLLRFLLALIYCDVMAGLALLFAQFLLQLDIPAMLPAAPWACALIAQPVLSAYVALYAYCQGIYDSRLRRLLHKGSH